MRRCRINRHYNPSVLEAFNSVEHFDTTQKVSFLTVFFAVCVNFFIFIVSYLVLYAAIAVSRKNTNTIICRSLTLSIVSKKELVNSSSA